MKKRLGFVSNSSSSSFVCDICGRIETGWDDSYADLGFVECQAGHVFCDTEKLDIDNITASNYLLGYYEEQIKRYEEYVKEGESDKDGYYGRNIERYSKYIAEFKGYIDTINAEGLDIDRSDILSQLDYIPSCQCPICTYSEPSMSDMSRFLKAKLNYENMEVLNEIKKVNKRRKVVRDHEVMEYGLKKIGKSADELLAEIKEEFPLYDDFLKHTIDLISKKKK